MISVRTVGHAKNQKPQSMQNIGVQGEQRKMLDDFREFFQAMEKEFVRHYPEKGDSWKILATVSIIRAGVVETLRGFLLDISSSAFSANSGVSKTLISLA